MVFDGLILVLSDFISILFILLSFFCSLVRDLSGLFACFSSELLLSQQCFLFYSSPLPLSFFLSPYLGVISCEFQYYMSCVVYGEMLFSEVLCSFPRWICLVCVPVTRCRCRRPSSVYSSHQMSLFSVYSNHQVSPRLTIRRFVYFYFRFSMILSRAFLMFFFLVTDIFFHSVK